jgi:hypothetical protein
MTDDCPRCGRPASLVCDALMFGKGVFCGLPVCVECAIPEFEDDDKHQFTLCPLHASHQHRTGETLREWIARVSP